MTTGYQVFYHLMKRAEESFRLSAVAGLYGAAAHNLTEDERLLIEAYLEDTGDFDINLQRIETSTETSYSVIFSDRLCTYRLALWCMKTA